MINRLEVTTSAGVRTAFLLAAAVAAGAGLFADQASAAESADELAITVGKSALVTSDQPIERVSVGYGEVAEAMAVGPREVLVNARAAGSTSLIVWQKGGGKLFFDVKVRPNPSAANDRLDAVRRQLQSELPGQEIDAAMDNDSVFLRGTARDLTSVNRAVAIASTGGKVVNLLYVDVPAPEPQIVLKVRFASVDRSNLSQLAASFISTGAGNLFGATSTQQYPSAALPQTSLNGTVASPFTFSDLLNIFLFRPDINAGAVLKALESKSLLQILAEPNVLTTNGKQGSFLAGGEFPYPVVQGAANFSTVTIQFREFGVRLNFIPTITPNGTIRLQVAPEVSSLDYTNGIMLNGFNVPGLIARKVKTEVELQQEQSFVIAGLLDHRVTDTFQKIPFIGDIPILGKFFQSKNVNKTNTELIVIVTPEIVRPIPAGSALPSPKFPRPFLDYTPESTLRNPAAGAQGTSAATSGAPPSKKIPVEELIQSLRAANPLDVNAIGVKQDSSTTTQSGPAAAAPGLPVNASN